MRNALLLTTLCVPMITFGAMAQSHHDFVARHGLSSGQYQQAFDELAAQGYQLTHVDAAATPNGERYAAIWRRGGATGFASLHGMDAGAYQGAFDNYGGQGWLISGISATGLGYDFGNFAAIWSRGTGAFVQARHGLTADDYQVTFNDLSAQGYRPTDVEGYATNQGVRFAALFQQIDGGNWAAHHDIDGAGFQRAFDEYQSRGMLPVQIDCYWTPSGPRYAGVWEEADGAFSVRHGLNSVGYQSEFDRHASEGYHLHHVSACWNGQDLSYAAIWRR